MPPSSSAADLSQTYTREGFDIVFLKIFESLSSSAMAGAAVCTGAIFDLSSNYVEKPAFESLRRFYDLYFGNPNIDAKKDTINSDVDNIVNMLQQKLEDGEEITLNTVVEEDEHLKHQRLSLSAMQKQLEGLVTLDIGIKDQILPALTSMQFEDAIRQRLEHVTKIWWALYPLMNSHPSPAELEAVARDLAKIMSSVDESTIFYRRVLNEEPPAGQVDRSIFIEF